MIMFHATGETAMGTAQTYRVRYTYDDYLLFPEDGRRHQIIDGEHIVTPSPNTSHQAISRNLLAILWTFLKSNPIGKVFDAPFDVVLSNEDVVQPDLLFVSAARASIITEKNVQGPPDLAVEILSETTRKMDEIVKRKLYERFSVKEYWIVDPELESVKVYRLTERGYGRPAEISLESGDALASPLLPGLSIPLAEVFAS
jgi:Uma2 family endonuclease